MPDGTPCLDTIHRCYEQVCLPGGCGNKRMDPGELCDDGNHSPGDGCAADCSSTEVCGNGVIDSIHGEVCDDADTISHDGCSSACDPEQPTWFETTETAGYTFSDEAIAYDSARDRVVQNGQALGEFDGNGWGRPHDVFEPPTLAGSRMAYDSRRHRLIMFGGHSNGSTNPNANTWAFDGRTWTVLDVAHSPPTRRNQMMAYDAKRDLVVMFGGSPDAQPVNGRNDTWLFDGTDWHQQTSADPPGRHSGSMVYDPLHDVIVMAGGRSDLTLYKDTWELDATGWHQKGDLPSARQLLALVFDPARGKVLATGGTDLGYGPFATNVLVYDNGGWSALSFGLTASLFGHGAVALASGKVIVLGGTIPGASGGLNTRVEQIDTGGISLRTPGQPGARSSHAMAALPGDRALMFGGADASNNVQFDTWMLVGAGWKQLSPSAHPSARMGHAMAYDSKHDQVVLFGGSDTSQPNNETWLWNGTTWTHVFPAHSPSPRFWHAMAYDPKLGLVVLHGGRIGTTSQSDSPETWTWDGSDWTLAAVGASNKLSLERAAMAYDPVHDQLLLFGGADIGGTRTNALWGWDGTQWNRIVPSASPEPRDAPLFAWNPARGRITLNGGNTGTGTLGDTWEWNGVAWSEVPIFGAQRYLAASISTSVGVMYYGGTFSTGADDLAGTLSWLGPRLDENCSSTGLDTDGDGLIGCKDPDCWAYCAPQCPPYVTCDPQTPRCGDGTCATYETCRNCPQDCGACTPVCGDSLCENEDVTCPGDCPHFP